MAGIFKKSDIRGTYGSNLTIDIAVKIGYMFAKLLGHNKQVVIAGDSRLSTPDLINAISKGLVKGGCIVNDIGLGPTPMVYFVSKIQSEIDGGIMVTASHNPPKDNGIKLCDKNGVSYHYESIYDKIEEGIANLPSFDQIEEAFEGKIVKRLDFADEYYNYLYKQFSYPSKLKIAVEYGNGAVGRFSEILEQLQFDVISIRKEPDGKFPTLVPDPSKDKTFEKLLEIIENDNFDIGIAFDADGDRIGFITSNGTIISPDKVIMVFAEDLIKKTGTAKILVDVKMSKASTDYIVKMGGTVALTQVGHSWVHENLISSRSDIAAELSCHYYFEDQYFGFDDGLYAALRMLKIVSHIKSSKRNLQEIIDELPEYSSTIEYRDPFPSDTQDKILMKLRKFTQEKGGKMIDIDGIRGEFVDGWFIARKSGTEEVLSYRIEGKTKPERDKLKRQILEIINNFRK